MGDHAPSIDAGTVLLLLGVGHVLLGLLIGLYRREDAENGPLNAWFWAQILKGVGVLGIAFRDLIPFDVSVHGGNSLIILGFALEMRAYLLYARRDGHGTVVIALLLGCLLAFNLGAALTADDASRLYPTVILSAAVAVFGTINGVVLLRSRADRSPILLILVGANLTMAAAALARAGSAALLGSHPPFADIPANQAAYLAAFIAMLANGVSFLLLVKEDTDAELRRLVTTDEMTGLANRRAFFERGDEVLALCRRLGRSATLAMLDVDRFKQINDTYGHAAGDAVLKNVATVLRREVRAVDLCARLGGEEFVVVLPGATAEQAVLALERVRSAIAASTVERAGQALRVTVSIGVATIDEGDSLDAALVRVDAALYAAKRRGRNRVVRHSAPDEHSPLVSSA